MQFSGKELFELGVPKKKIKNFINKEFESAEEVLQLATAKKEEKEYVYTWVEWLVESIPYLPMTSRGNKAVTMSKSELRRLLDDKAILINQQTPTAAEPVDKIGLPVEALVFWPNNNKRRTTYA